jgi:hypothetical protein
LTRAPIIEIDLRSILGDDRIHSMTHLITPFESPTAYACGGHAETMGIIKAAAASLR